MEALRVPGMAVAVVGADGPVLVEGFGLRDIERDLPVTPDTLFYIASATKPFVALATAQLADGGALDLNRPVKTYLPRFELADHTETITITVRDLLAHRRGLQDYAITFGEAFSGQMTEDRFYRLLPRVEAVGELDYGNLHYTLLGRVIEAVSGLGWKEYIENDVLAPADMSRTTTRAAPLGRDANAAVPYEVVDGRSRAARTKSDRTMHAAGGMLSTAEDLGRWIRIHLDEGRLGGRVVYPEDVIKEVLTPQIYEEEAAPLISDHRRIGWGLGWDVREDRGDRLYFHGGTYEGWAAHLSFVPAIETGVVVLTNERDAGQWLTYVVAMDVYDRVRGLEPRDFLPELLAFREQVESRASPLTGDKSAPRGPSLPLDRYAAVYHEENWGTLEVAVLDGELRMRIGDLPLPLVWTGIDAFVADEDHEGRFLEENGFVTGVSLDGLEPDESVLFTRREGE